MPLTIDTATVRLSRELLEAEAAVADALARVANLKSTMAVARRDTDVPFALGQDAMLRAHKVENSLLSATGDLARVHNSLLGVAREYCAGDVDPDCLDPKGLVDAEMLAA